MSKTTPGGMAAGASNVIRDDVSSADSTTINDTNFVPGNATIGAGWAKVVLFPRFNAGTAPTVTIQILHRCTAVGSPANGWIVGDKSSPLTEGGAFVVDVMGRDFYARVDAITGSPTNVDIHCAGWEPFRYDGPRGS